MEQPHVSVVIAAYNAMPYLTRCVESVLGQSLAPDAVEVVAVDDGSTDGTGAELDRFARLHPGRVRVVHQANSGGPAAPRNAGIELARGRYVFFLDADDYLGPEALERMTAMADEHGSDVVVGKLVGVGGRTPPQSMFKRDQPDADLYRSRVFWVLNPMKLFRRALIERHRLRFPEDLRTGEDQIFVTRAYLHAARISVLAEYDCVHYVRRDDGGNLTTTARRTTGADGGGADTLARMFDLVGEHVPAGPRRDHLLKRLFQVNLQRALRGVRREPDGARARRMFAVLHAAVARWYSETAMAKLPAIVRLQGELVRRDRYEEAMEVVAYVRRRRQALAGDGSRPPARWLLPAELAVEDGRVLARYPYFRDPRLGLPDSVFDVTRQVAARTFVRPATVTVARDPRESRVLVVRGRRRARLPAVALEATATREGDRRTVTVPVPPPAADGGHGFTARIRVPRPGTWRLELRIAGVVNSSWPIGEVETKEARQARRALARLGRRVRDVTLRT